MTCWALIPTKPAADGKSRLAGALDGPARAALVTAMLAHVVEQALSARLIDHVAIVSNEAPALPECDPAQVTVLPDPGGGLNSAIAGGVTALAERGATRVVIVAGDLPQLRALELDLLAAAPADKVVLAPDRHGTGTNAIALSLPAAAGFAFAYGLDSLSRHRAAAERLGVDVETIVSEGLARDVDEPADLADADALMRPGP